MTAIRHQFEAYLSSAYPKSKIDTEHSLAGVITIRFSTTDEDLLEPEDRIAQTVNRGLVIWTDLFSNPDELIWILIYEYLEDDFIEYDTQYLFDQISHVDLNAQSADEEMVNSRMVIAEDEKGNYIFEKTMAKLTIINATIKNIKIENILLGIANRDNGQDPAIGQCVYFFNPKNDTGFHVADDRGIFAWANKPDTLKEIYKKYETWIPQENKEDIKDYFH